MSQCFFNLVAHLVDLILVKQYRFKKQQHPSF